MNRQPQDSKQPPESRNAVLIVAAGSGERFGHAVPKQYFPLAGKNTLRWCLEAFENHPTIDTITVVYHPDHHDFFQRTVLGLKKVTAPVPGGADRQQSVRNGLQFLQNQSTTPTKTLIHDGARPLISAETITAVLEALSPETPGAIAACPVVDTLKRDEGTNLIKDTVDRNNLWRAQTPQGFLFTDILQAHENAASSDQSFTDDASIAEFAGIKVRLIPDRVDNIKVTTPQDVTLAEALLNARRGDIRTGTGYDVHRLIEPEETAVQLTQIRLGGVDIAHSHILKGHSDADVALHAITDALFGTLCDGDIGSHFSPKDPRWQNADSALFLAHVAGLIRNRSGEISHIDLTIICEAPKIGPHREKIRNRVADILEMPVDTVSVKATTTEKLGFTGRGEGIAAEAVATVRFPVVNPYIDLAAVSVQDGETEPQVKEIKINND